MVCLNNEIEERIAPAIEQAQMPVELKKRRNCPNGRDNTNDRYTDGEERQRYRGRQYGHRRWEECDHRYRVPRGGGGRHGVPPMQLRRPMYGEPMRTQHGLTIPRAN